ELRIERSPEFRLEAAKERAIAAQPARFQQARLHGDVLSCKLRALARRAHAVADFQPDVPERPDQPLDAKVAVRLRFALDENQQIDVRAWKELAAAVTADRNQRTG